MTSTSSGLTMLTSGVSQYLHPDYLQPLPTTLDAKKSPLALLAQTCSAIGKDTAPSKPIIPPLEKKDNEKSDKNADSESKRPSSHGNKDSGRDSKPGFRTFPPKEIPPLVPISVASTNEKAMMSSSNPESKPSPVSDPASANQSNSSSSSSSSSSRPVSASNGQRSSSRSSTGKGEEHHSHSHSHAHSHHQHQHHRSSRDSPSSSSSSSGSASHPVSSSPSYSKPSSSQSTPVMHSPSSSSSSAMKPSPSAHPSLLGGLPTPAHLAGYPHPLSLMGHGLDPSSSSYHSALAAHSSLSSFSAAASAAVAAQSSALKAAAASAAGTPSALSPFVTYARVRTPSGATSLVPVCRDPFCTNCQLTLQNSHLSSTCNAPGCAQCAHEKSLTSLSTLGLPGAGVASSLLLPSLSSAGSLSSNMSALSSLHSLYPHSALAAAHQGLPFVCNWVSGNEYCGKRFTSSEDLLQHLRTHTSSMDASTLAAASYAGLGLQPSALAAYPHLASAPLSPNSLRRTYPTSLSPVSSLLGSSRYHPYKSPLSGVPATPPAPQSFAPVGPYYSPYTLYGQRLGAAVVP